MIVCLPRTCMMVCMPRTGAAQQETVQTYQYERINTNVSPYAHTRNAPDPATHTQGMRLLPTLVEKIFDPISLFYLNRVAMTLTCACVTRGWWRDVGDWMVEGCGRLDGGGMWAKGWWRDDARERMGEGCAQGKKWTKRKSDRRTYRPSNCK